MAGSLLNEGAQRPVWPAVVAPLLTVLVAVWALGSFQVAAGQAEATPVSEASGSTSPIVSSPSVTPAGPMPAPAPTEDPDPPTLYVAVPDVAGETVDDATARLRADGLEVVEAGEDPERTGRVGTVVRTDPPASAQVPTATAVRLFTPGRPVEVPVPDVVGLTYPDAIDVLLAVGLNASPDPFTAPDTATVISQTPLAGATAPPASAVTLALS